MDNGILELTLAKPEGSVLGVKYNGVENLLSPRNGKHAKGYRHFPCFCSCLG